MHDLLLTLGTPPVSDYFLGFCLAVMIVPMLALARWYHRNIGNTEGGRRLMRRQNRSNILPRGSFLSALSQMSEGTGMMRDIQSGRYGKTARRMQLRVYWITGAWLVANVICFGLLIWAQEVAKSAIPAQ